MFGFLGERLLGFCFFFPQFLLYVGFLYLCYNIWKGKAACCNYSASCHLHLLETTCSFVVFLLLYWNQITWTCVLPVQYSRFLELKLLHEEWDRAIRDRRKDCAMNFDRLSTLLLWKTSSGSSISASTIVGSLYLSSKILFLPEMNRAIKEWNLPPGSCTHYVSSADLIGAGIAIDNLSYWYDVS